MKKYKICILCNFSYPHVGGSESVLRDIAIRLVNNYNYEISVYSFSCMTPFSENGIKYFPCPRGNVLISEIAKFDHTLIYSDSFWEYDTVVKNIDKVPQIVSVCLVGGYHMQSHPEILGLLKKNISRFNLVAHSKITVDYKWCIDNNLPAKVVPNGVSLFEFNKKSEIDIREKYNIKEKYIILNVSSYFYGKGFELLPQIANKLSEDLDDFIIIQCSNVIKYPYDKVFFERTKKQCKGLPVRFLRDVPREDIIAFFRQSDVSSFFSKKEVSPLVVLESRAAKLPFVAMRVGNVPEQGGGIPVFFEDVDKKGYAIVDSNVISHFSCAIVQLLKLERLRGSVIKDGQKDIEKIDWENIVPLYDEIFRNEV